MYYFFCFLKFILNHQHGSKCLVIFKLCQVIDLLVPEFCTHFPKKHFQKGKVLLLLINIVGFILPPIYTCRLLSAVVKMGWVFWALICKPASISACKINCFNGPIFFFNGNKFYNY